MAQHVGDVADSAPIAASLQQRRELLRQLEGMQMPRPARTRVIAVANQKGGVGKTTTSVNLAAALAQAGLNVVVIDSDPQGNASTALQVDNQRGVHGTYQVLIGQDTLAAVLRPCPTVPNLRVCPATLDLAAADLELIDVQGREFQLRRALDDFLAGQDAVDYVIIDCPPSLGLLTVNAFVAAREVLIPIQAEYYALEGLQALQQATSMVRGGLNPGLGVAGILLTMVDLRTNLARDVVKEITAKFPDQTFRVTIPRSVRLSEAPGYGETIITFDPQSIGAIAYRRAAFELANREVQGHGE